MLYNLGRAITLVIVVIILAVVASLVLPPLWGMGVSAWNRVVGVRTPVLAYEPAYVAEGATAPAEKTVSSVPTQASELAMANEPEPVTTSACRHAEWFTGPNGAMNTTTDVAGLLAKLDRDFQLVEGGEWSNAGFTVPEGSVFWTDLFMNKLPKGVVGVRQQGGWGVYKTGVNYTIPNFNGGGRFVRVCEGVSGIPAAPTAPVEQGSPAPSAAKPTCITDTEIGIIMNASNQGQEYDHFFEGKGYQFGKPFQGGETAQAGWLLHANGAVFETAESTKLAEGGRGMPVCK